MNTRISSCIVAASIAGLANAALAGHLISVGPSAPTYAGLSLDFDQPGDPAPGFGGISQTYWQPTHGITFAAGDSVLGAGQVESWDPLFAGGGGWLGDAQSLRGPFGQTFEFDTGITELSLQMWSNAGPPSLFGGGVWIRMYDGGALVDELQVTPAWLGSGDEWVSVVADGGDTFDKVWLSPGGGNPNHVFTDNYSWNVPAPGSLTLIGGAGLALLRRRRA